VKGSIALACAVLLAACGSGGGKNRPNNNLSGTSARQEAAQTQVSLGAGYIAKGRYEYALEALERAVRLDPKSSDAFTTMGLLYERIERPKLAEEKYRKAAEIAPRRGSVHNNLGQFLCGIGQYEEAAKEFAVALDDPFYPTPELAASNAGTCARAGGDFKLAEQFLRVALERKPNFIQAYLPMAQVLSERGDFMKARAFVQRYEASGQGMSPEFYALASKVETKLRNSVGAKEYNQKLLEQFPQSEQAKQLRSEAPSD
jgi:type IV pilus assembly protein PilF